MLSILIVAVLEVRKRNQLVALLNYNDVDVVFACETHIHPDESIYSSEILPKAYKSIRKDRCPGDGDVLVGFKDPLTISEISITIGVVYITIS